MSKLGFFSELENIHYKYQRLEALISIVSECIEVAEVSEKSLCDALYEIELQISKNNKKLKEILNQEKE